MIPNILENNLYSQILDTISFQCDFKIGLGAFASLEPELSSENQSISFWITLYILGFFELSSCRSVFANLKDEIKIADQDILNAIFGQSPWYMYELPCTWNFIVWQCRGPHDPRTWPGKMQCAGGCFRLGLCLHALVL